MKWAPNKKLHFEVAVIKAIQTLEQVTLNEVIENLSALRDGDSAPAAPKTARRSPVEPPKPVSVARSLRPSRERREKLSRPQHQKPAASQSRKRAATAGAG